MPTTPSIPIKYLARPYLLKPNLAVDFPTISPDGLTYTFRLKKGVRYVDDPCFAGGRGREVVAEDFIYSIKRQFDPAEPAPGRLALAGAHRRPR